MSTGDVKFLWHPKWVRLAPYGTILGLFKISFSTFWLAEPPFGANLTHFGCHFWICHPCTGQAGVEIECLRLELVGHFHVIHMCHWQHSWSTSSTTVDYYCALLTRKKRCFVCSNRLVTLLILVIGHKLQSLWIRSSQSLKHIIINSLTICKKL